MAGVCRVNDQVGAHGVARTTQRVAVGDVLARGPGGGVQPDIGVLRVVDLRDLGHAHAKAGAVVCPHHVEGDAVGRLQVVLAGGQGGGVAVRGCEVGDEVVHTDGHRRLSGGLGGPLGAQDRGQVNRARRVCVKAEKLAARALGVGDPRSDAEVSGDRVVGALAAQAVGHRGSCLPGVKVEADITAVERERTGSQHRSGAHSGLHTVHGEGDAIVVKVEFDGVQGVVVANRYGVADRGAGGRDGQRWPKDIGRFGGTASLEGLVVGVETGHHRPLIGQDEHKVYGVIHGEAVGDLDRHLVRGQVGREGEVGDRGARGAHVVEVEGVKREVAVTTSGDVVPVVKVPLIGKCRVGPVVGVVAESGVKLDQEVEGVGVEHRIGEVGDR